MEKEFALYPEALALKELGFDEPCFGFWSKIHGLFITTTLGKLNEDAGECLAPTYSQAFRWFREKQAIEGFIHKAIEGTYYFVIKRLGNNESNMYEFITNAPKNVDTYEEAELECLKKLIEIVESKK